VVERQLVVVSTVALVVEAEAVVLLASA